MNHIAVGSRIIVLGLGALAFCTPVFPAVPAGEGPEAVRALIEAGAPQLALTRIEALQPADPGAPRWADWEAIRCEVLARLGRKEALLARGASLPPERSLPTVCLLESARAAVLQNEGPLARIHAAQLLWQSKATAAEVQSARLAVIESYVVERRGEEAYRSMLRFQQDYQPLEPAVARRFAEALLDVGRDREALNWIGASGESTPTRLRLQLRSAGLTPEAVIAQARAGYAKTQDPAYWRVVLEASARKKNLAAEVEARERLLQHAGVREEGTTAAEAARQLLQTYLATANDIGNRQGLLVGDDAGWSDYAARRVASDPPVSRAFYAYLAQRAQSSDMRRNAQLSLAFLLSQAKLDYTALRVMRELGVPLEKLDGQTRYLLGTIAANRNDPALALRLWDGLQTPPNVKAEEWQLALARAALRAGNSRASVEAVHRLLDGGAPPTPEAFRGALDVAQEMVDARQLAEARAVYEALVRTGGSGARDALLGLGRVYELDAQPAAAAAAYLRAARAADATSVQARLSAGMNLRRAGMKDDARAQFEWVLKNSKDQALVDAARRALLLP